MGEKAAEPKMAVEVPLVEFRTFDAARIEQVMAKDMGLLEESIHAYERAKIVSQTILDYQVRI
jgi:hypothetical protein